ncbi:hypothetical protein [uncultured Phycicoccus sp.]|uniref:hypothetical protein n=1 Tax=uncultured Phycicoccus sp. TaxID=661422 RepID=UPI0026151D87|nr:hypothetical protein [uncultured Phycicoccus sp.]
MRTEHDVVVDGWGRVADETVAQLRRMRVTVRCGAHAADAAELEMAGGGAAPALVVLVADHATDAPAPWVRAPSMAAPWHAHRVPQLPLVAGCGHLTVGPLVVPRRSACLACVTRPDAGEAGGTEPVTPGAVVLAAAVVTVTTLAVLRGDTSPAGISTEIGAGGLDVAHRVWGSRPGCGCASARMVG